jgi:hypothetical protein
MAEYFYAIGQPNAAIMQIKLAQNDKGLNFYLSAGSDVAVPVWAGWILIKSKYIQTDIPPYPGIVVAISDNVF